MNNTIKLLKSGDFKVIPLDTGIVTKEPKNGGLISVACEGETYRKYKDTFKPIKKWKTKQRNDGTPTN